MSLLDAARKMVADCPTMTDRGGRGECYYCGGGNYEGCYLSGSPTLPDARHESRCPWLAIPKIVAALEAAAVVVDAFDSSSLCGTVSVRDADFHEALEDMKEALDA